MPSTGFGEDFPDVESSVEKPGCRVAFVHAGELPIRKAVGVGV